MARQSDSKWWQSLQRNGALGASGGRARADYQNVGLELVASILLGLFGGRWLDAKLGANGWLTMVGFAFGVATGFRFLYRAAVKMRMDTEAEDERERRSKGGTGTPPTV